EVGHDLGAASAADVLSEGLDGDRGHDADDRQDDHHFDQRKPANATASVRIVGRKAEPTHGTPPALALHVPAPDCPSSPSYFKSLGLSRRSTRRRVRRGLPFATTNCGIAPKIVNEECVFVVISRHATIFQ